MIAGLPPQDTSQGGHHCRPGKKQGFGGFCRNLALTAENRSQHEHPSSTSRAGLQKASNSTADARHQADGRPCPHHLPAPCLPGPRNLGRRNSPSSADRHLRVPNAWQEATVDRAKLATARASGPAGCMESRAAFHPSASTELVCQRHL